MKTPIQELIEEMQKSPIMYSSGLLAIDILKIKQKEKEFARQCFEAGVNLGWYNASIFSEEDDKPEFRDFETFYKQFKQ